MNANGGSWALHYVCYNGHANVIPVLVDAGADVNAKDVDGVTIPVLVDAGADVNSGASMVTPT